MNKVESLPFGQTPYKEERWEIRKLSKDISATKVSYDNLIEYYITLLNDRSTMIPAKFYYDLIDNHVTEMKTLQRLYYFNTDYETEIYDVTKDGIYLR